MVRYGDIYRNMLGILRILRVRHSEISNTCLECAMQGEDKKK